jgi:hypothetical protein
VTPKGSTHVDMLTGTTSSISRTAAGKVAVSTVVRHAFVRHGPPPGRDRDGSFDQGGEVARWPGSWVSGWACPARYVLGLTGLESLLLDGLGQLHK